MVANERLNPSQGKAPLSHDTKLRIFLSVLLLSSTLLTYYPVGQSDFVSIDDPYYVTDNPDVQRGFTLKSVVWAFTSVEAAAYWHPVTWLSHMADCHLFGLNSSAHHLSNLLVHLLNVILLFLLLNRMTGAIWRAALVAALFALHPLNVESVAWVAERKNLLSTFLGFLTIWAYVSYTRRRTARNYTLILITLALGLMAKPMLVTLPFLLLLLDFWPLQRLRVSDSHAAAQQFAPHRGAQEKERLIGLVREKAPLLALSMVSSIITLKTQAPAIASLHALPLTVRMTHIVLSYFSYFLALFWPVNLAVFYPYQGAISTGHIALSAALVFGGSVIALWTISSRPYLAVGWFWFLGSLVPVIGLVQSGMQARADRFVYIPFIGLFVILSWGLAEIVKAVPRLRAPMVLLCFVVLAVLAIDTRKQVAYWHDSSALYRHALLVTRDNYAAHYGLGLVLNSEGDTAGALEQFRKSVQINPNSLQSSTNLEIGQIKEKQGQLAEAEKYFRAAINLPNDGPTLAMAHIRLANLLENRNDPGEAATEYREAVRLNPREAYSPKLHLGALLAKQGDYAGAAEEFSQIIKESPSEASLYFLLGEVEEKQGQISQAAEAYRKAVQLQPAYAPAQIKLNAISARLR